MAKQKALGASFDNEFEDEFEHDYDLDEAGGVELDSVPAEVEVSETRHADEPGAGVGASAHTWGARRATSRMTTCSR